MCTVCILGWSIPAVSAKENAEIAKLADGIYARIVTPDGDEVSNAGIVVLEHCVLVFDTHFTPEAGQGLQAAIRSITSKPVRFVVNSHAHADHTHGNQVFADAQLISSSAARRDVLQLDVPSLNRTVGVAQSQVDKLRRESSREKNPAQLQDLRDQIKTREAYIQTMSRLKITAPFVTLDDSLKIQDGKQEARVLSLGKGHTDGDVIVFLPAARIAFVGDLFFNDAIPNVQDASVLAWMDTLEEVLKLEADKFVPGHGAVGDKKAVQQFLGYFKDLRSLVNEAVERGDTMEQATRDITVPAKYSKYRFQNFFPSNVQKMYTELKMLQAPAPVPAKPAAKQ